MKKQGKKWMLVALALLALVMVALPLVGCKNDTVAEQTGGNAEQPATPGTGDQGSGSGNQGSGDPEQPETYTVSFKTNGGGFIDSQTIVSGQTATKPADPTLENNVFGGWYSDEELTSEYDFTTPVTGSFTLYAKWVKRIEVTASSVSSVIEGLTGEEPHTLVATGYWSSVHLSAIKAALNEKPTAKVNLDLREATGLTEIGAGAFYECRGLTSISIPEGVEIIGPEAFRGCRGLTSISIPSSVEIIGGNAFDGCYSLTSIDLSKATGLTTIVNYAFYECSELTSISIPSSVTSIGDAAFYGCSSLNISVKENNTKYSSVNGMLLNKEKTILIADPSAKVTVNNVPTSVTTIGNYAFSGCSGLTRISIPSSVTSIGEYAFDGWRSLTSISIPSSVTSIGARAFAGCSGTTVKVEAENPPILGSGVFEDVSKILVPSGAVNYYKSAEGWSDYEDKIEAIPE